MKVKLANRYNKRHRTKNLVPLDVGSKVWVTDLRDYGRVKRKLNNPRSYEIETSKGTTKRNRWHLIPASCKQIVTTNSKSVCSMRFYRR